MDDLDGVYKDCGPEKLMVKFLRDCESILAGQESKPVL